MGADQRELAAAVGVTFHQIRKYEDGENRISASMLVRIAAKLESTVAAFVGEDGPNPVKTAMHVQLAQPDTADLLTAFAEIPSSKARQALLRVVQAVVSDQPA